MKIFLPQGTKKRQRRKKSYRQWFVLLGILFIIAGAGVALRETRILVIQNVVVGGQKRLTAQEVADATRMELNDPVLRFIHPNMLFFPEKRLREHLLAQFPRIGSVTLKRSFTQQTLRIKIVEREQEGIYCAGDVPAEPQEEGAGQSVVILGCYLIDASGVIFAEAPQTEGGLILSLVDMTNTELILGREAISPENFQEVQELWETFRVDVGVGISRLIRQDEDLLIVQTLEGWEALFDMNGDTMAQAVALRELLAKELTPQKRASVTTIDLRIPGKIYYR